MPLAKGRMARIFLNQGNEFPDALPVTASVVATAATAGEATGMDSTEIAGSRASFAGIVSTDAAFAFSTWEPGAAVEAESSVISTMAFASACATSSSGAGDVRVSLATQPQRPNAERNTRIEMVLIDGFNIFTIPASRMNRISTEAKMNKQCYAH